MEPRGIEPLTSSLPAMVTYNGTISRSLKASQMPWMALGSRSFHGRDVAVGKEVSPKIIVEWMESIRGEVIVSQACAWIGLPRATYYRWKASYGRKCKDHMVEKIRELCRQHKFRYGYRKIAALLRREHRINHKRVQRIMQREGLRVSK
nr:IS3 family transposase [Paenibacillus solani]